MKMSLWTMWEAFFGFFCLFSKLFSKRLNQNLSCAIGEKEKSDAESQNCTDKRKYHVKQESVYLDSHFLATEKEGKSCGRLVTRRDCFRSDPMRDTAVKRDHSRPVHEAIELFNKPNDIETSLPRYQNKISRISKNRSFEECKRKSVQVDMEKLREQLEQKLASRLQKCKSERDFRASPASANKSDKKRLSKLKNEEKYGVECVKEKPETDRKSEKEKHNSLLKVNLSHVNKSEVTLASTLKSKIPDKLTRLAEEQYLKKMGKNGEYGGGWECHRCGKRVYHAERMLACGNAYHKNCFSCVTCKKLLAPRTYLEAEMEIYCSQCHAKSFGLTGYGYGLGPAVLQTSP